MRKSHLLLAAAAMIGLAGPAGSQGSVDPDNPTCPEKPNWSTNQTMELTPVDRDGQTVLLAEGRIDSGLPARLQQVLDANPDITEIWLRSPGGDAIAGNDAGTLLRVHYPGLITRIPEGWTCFSACNFVFMGGELRIIEPGGNFMVHMFTYTGDRDALRQRMAEGDAEAAAIIQRYEQGAALMATEDNDFLIRMGISRALLTDLMYTTSVSGDGETRRCLNQDEAYHYNVANVPAF